VRVAELYGAKVLEAFNKSFGYIPEDEMWSKPIKKQNNEKSTFDFVEYSHARVAAMAQSTEQLKKKKNSTTQDSTQSQLKTSQVKSESNKSGQTKLENLGDDAETLRK
jgi:hypothetical protein